MPPSASASRPQPCRPLVRSDGSLVGAAPAQSLRADRPHEPATLRRAGPPRVMHGRSGGSAAGWISRRITASSEDAIHFHRTCRDALAPFGAEYHPRFKAACDDYFFLKHRGEPRGIGGIFFDDLNERGFEHCFALTRSVGRLTFSPPTSRFCFGARIFPTPSASATSRPIAADAMSSSIWSTIAARFSGFSRTAVPKRSSCLCRPSSAGATTGGRNPAARRKSSTPNFSSRATGWHERAPG